jgi:hypothetical protein
MVGCGKRAATIAAKSRGLTFLVDVSIQLDNDTCGAADSTFFTVGRKESFTL